MSETTTAHAEVIARLRFGRGPEIKRDALNAAADVIEHLLAAIPRAYDLGYEHAASHACGCLRDETPESHDRDDAVALLIEGKAP